MLKQPSDCTLHTALTEYECHCCCLLHCIRRSTQEFHLYVFFMHCLIIFQCENFSQKDYFYIHRNDDLLIVMELQIFQQEKQLHSIYSAAS